MKIIEPILCEKGRTGAFGSKHETIYNALREVSSSLAID